MKLIVVDPRRTETARRAHVHLQLLPGEDPTLLAGIIHVILAENLHDPAFRRERTPKDSRRYDRPSPHSRRSMWRSAQASP